MDRLTREAVWRNMNTICPRWRKWHGCEVHSQLARINIVSYVAWPNVTETTHDKQFSSYKSSGTERSMGRRRRGLKWLYPSQNKQHSSRQLSIHLTAERTALLASFCKERDLKDHWRSQTGKRGKFASKKDWPIDIPLELNLFGTKKNWDIELSSDSTCTQCASMEPTRSRASTPTAARPRRAHNCSLELL